MLKNTIHQDKNILSANEIKVKLSLVITIVWDV